MKFVLPELPYPTHAYAGFLSNETFEYHYGKHHKTYIDNLNRLKEGTSVQEKSLEEIVLTQEGGIFNNAAQSWNHTFYWLGMTPQKGTQPSAELMTLLQHSFGSLDGFKTAFIEKAATLFGSGWTWLTKDKEGKLNIVNTSNAENPLRNQHTPLLTCDVWEHAYYIDFRNNRKAYIEKFWDHVNWNFVSDQLKPDAYKVIGQKMVG